MNNYESFTDTELVKRSLEDKDFFKYIVERYQSKLSRYLHRLSALSREDTEDLLQNVFIKTYQNLNGFDEKLKFSSWIYRIAHNEAISFWRRQKIRPQTLELDLENDLLQNLAADFEMEVELDKKLLEQSVQKIFAQMDEKYLEVLVLRFLEENEYEEIADILKKPIGTVATLLNRAKKQFKEIYAKTK